MKAIEFMGKYKMWLIIGITVIIILVAVYLWGRKSQKTANQQALPKDTMDGLTDMENAKIAEYAGKLYEDMNGWNAWGHDNKLWENFLLETDRIYIGTYNYFNSKYSPNETLYQFLKNETSIVPKLGWEIPRKENLARMEKLNLK
ncbi:MAG: hypothetical protein LBN27_11135 [Prevotellaceae bacterium]|jgi:hypothetical protein|nr:hypothetical protein [Prevotellaceae bacterium]